MYKILALFGPSGAGKDTIQKWYASHADINEIISATTRPPREYEQDTVDYYFLTDEEFTDKVLDGSMLEVTSFRGWYYGTPIESLKEDKINIGVFNLDGLDILLRDDRVQVLPVYINASNKTRILRCLNREQAPDVHEVCRRFLKDEEDFANVNIPCELVLNPDDDIEKLAPRLYELLGNLEQD